MTLVPCTVMWWGTSHEVDKTHDETQDGSANQISNWFISRQTDFDKHIYKRSGMIRMHHDPFNAGQLIHFVKSCEGDVGHDCFIGATSSYRRALT
jgi:hypothetical protein